MEINTRYFKTAGITFEIHSEYQTTGQTFHPKINLFETNQPGKDKVIINHIFNIPTRLKNLENSRKKFSSFMYDIFNPDELWIYKKKQALPELENNIAFFEFGNDLRMFNVYADFLTQEKYSRGLFNSLTLFGFDQLLITRLLTERNGLILHSNAFIHNGSGRLLAGTSGSGKTTLTRMLEKKGFQVFADDRMILKVLPEETMMHGSWLHGTTPLVTKGVRKMDTIFFLEQSEKNQIIPVQETNQKIGLVLQAIVRPHIDAENWKKLLETVENMLQNVSCYRLLFNLSGEITSLMEKI